MVEGQEVKAGKYALFTIPAKEEWTVILNNNPKQWGAYKYNADENAHTFKVKPMKNSHFHERLTFSFKDKTEKSSKVVMEWENLAVALDVETDIIKTTYPVIIEGLKIYDENPNAMRPIAYTMAVGFAADHEAYLDEAKKWCEVALEVDNWYSYMTAARLYKVLGEKDTALEYIEKSRKFGEGNPFYTEEATSQLDVLEEELENM